MNNLRHQVAFKAFLFLSLFALTLIGAISFSFLHFSKKRIDQNVQQTLVLGGENVVTQLQIPQFRNEATVTALAHVATLIENDSPAVRKTIINILNNVNVKSGGIWPLPYALDPKKERTALFFTREDQERFSYNDGYNAKEAPAYYKEPWFTHAAKMNSGETTWSDLYIDPITKVKMVTVSTPIYKEDVLFGVATIDVAIDHVAPIIKKIAQKIQGYIFLSDASNQLITASHKGIADNYKNIATTIKDHTLDVALQSYNLSYNTFLIEKDLFLHVKSYGIVYKIPKLNWHIGLIISYDRAFKTAHELLFNINAITVILTLLIAILGYLILRKIIINPIRDISRQLHINKNFNIEDLKPITTNQKGEIGELVTTLNERTSMLKALQKEIEDTQKEVIFTMGAVGESRSKETGNHVKRVAEYSKILALHYGLDEKEAEMLKQASPMHDIGKVAIPDAILNKPGPFNQEERRIMNTHAQLGYEMLKMSNRHLLKMAATVAHEHHEKYNGTGYPQGLSGENIHIYGRITALADVFDALGSDRVYKKAWDDEKIFQLFKEERGEHFDPKLIDIFFEHLDEFLAIRDTFKDTISSKH
jgi:HD-GYP domain-containing protein (c-di-GMP phosphodiesterase class II)